MPATDFDYDQLYPGRFMKAGEFQNRDVTLTISKVELEEMEDRKGKRPKPILTFNGTAKQLVLVKTNGECLKGMFGRRVSDWVGKRVTFYPAKVEAFGEETLAIRVRGSPDIANDLEITLNLGQKSRKVTMRKTGQKPAAAAPAAQPASAAAPPPPPPSSSLPIGDVNAEPPSDFPS